MTTFTTEDREQAQAKEKYGIVHTEGPVMELTLMVGCPLMCSFCPQDNLRNEYGTAGLAISSTCYSPSLTTKYMLRFTTTCQSL